MFSEIYDNLIDAKLNVADSFRWIENNESINDNTLVVFENHDSKCIVLIGNESIPTYNSFTNYTSRKVTLSFYYLYKQQPCIDCYKLIIPFVTMVEQELSTSSKFEKNVFYDEISFYSFNKCISINSPTNSIEPLPFHSIMESNFLKYISQLGVANRLGVDINNFDYVLRCFMTYIMYVPPKV